MIAETIQKFRLLKKSTYIIVLMNSLERAIWNWMDTYPHEFADVHKKLSDNSTKIVGSNVETQKKSNENLAKACDELFDILDTFAENKKGRIAAVWPLQIMLLILSPKVFEEIVNADCGAPCSPKYAKKKQFIEGVKRGLGMHGGSSRALMEAAAVTCVKLCKASTYVNNLNSSNVIFTLVQIVMGDLTALLFNPSKPFSRGQNAIAQDIDLMIDCFVSCFRIKPNNDEVIKVCIQSLNSNSPPFYQFVLVSSLYRIATQLRLPWWPQIDIIYPRSAELRNLFTDILGKVTQNYISHTPLRMIQSLTMKGKEQGKYKDRGEDITSHRNLLLWIVRLIHTDPMLMLHNQDKGRDFQSSTLELINGLVTLVHQPTMPDIANESMEALLVLHHPDKIKSWNPEAPIKTFWDVSSQVLFSISEKLIQHSIVNYTDILKWLREILIRRNLFLSQNKDYANVGSQIAICKQAHITLEVVFFMHLWSIDMEAVLVALSCFSLLCEEADIRCGSDEVAVTCLLPNYQLYIELAQTSTALITGEFIYLFIFI